jgi:hypothetical protein
MMVEMMLTSINAAAQQDLDRQALQSLKHELERKQEQQEELISSLQRHRADLLKKQEDTRMDYDEKIELLLQQLRAAEERVNHLLANNAALPPAPTSRPSTADGRYRSASSAKVSSASPASGNLTARSIERSIPDRQLLHGAASQSDEYQKETSMDNGYVSAQIHQEVIRRWQAEKDRRVLLESRTAELSKELRLLKSKSSNNGSNIIKDVE